MNKLIVMILVASGVVACGSEDPAGEPESSENPGDPSDPTGDYDTCRDATWQETTDPFPVSINWTGTTLLEGSFDAPGAFLVITPTGAVTEPDLAECAERRVATSFRLDIDFLLAAEAESELRIPLGAESESRTRVLLDPAALELSPPVPSVEDFGGADPEASEEPVISLEISLRLRGFEGDSEGFGGLRWVCAGCAGAPEGIPFAEVELEALAAD